MKKKPVKKTRAAASRTKKSGASRTPLKKMRSAAPRPKTSEPIVTSGQSVSIWLADGVRPNINAKLARTVRADVCIVGAGIAGLTTAYLLGREGQSVVVVDD